MIAYNLQQIEDSYILMPYIITWCGLFDVTLEDSDWKKARMDHQMDCVIDVPNVGNILGFSEELSLGKLLGARVGDINGKTFGETVG